MKPDSNIRPLIDALCARYQSSDEGLNATIDLAVLVALSDDRIDDAEMEALATSLEVLVGGRLDPKVARYLILQSRNQIQAAGVEGRATAIGESLAAHGAVDDGIRLALAIALASEGLSDEERRRIEVVAAGAGTPPSRIDELQAAL